MLQEVEDEVLMQMTEKKHPKGRKKSWQREMLCGVSDEEILVRWKILGAL